MPDRLQDIVEWRFAHLEKPKKKMEDKAVPAAVVDGETSGAAAKPAAKSTKIGKLLPRNKSRLPRRQKKAQHKAASRP